MATVGVRYLCKAFTENKLESLKNDTEKELGFGATTFVVNKGQKAAVVVGFLLLKAFHLFNSLFERPESTIWLRKMPVLLIRSLSGGLLRRCFPKLRGA